jgi:hypothetical protein
MTTKSEDWQECRYLWQDMMRIEAASLGYDFEGGRIASKAYSDACTAYEAKHGEEFSPHLKPEGVAA